MLHLKPDNLPLFKTIKYCLTLIISHTFSVDFLLQNSQGWSSQEWVLTLDLKIFRDWWSCWSWEFQLSYLMDCAKITLSRKTKNTHNWLTVLECLYYLLREIKIKQMQVPRGFWDVTMINSTLPFILEFVWHKVISKNLNFDDCAHIYMAVRLWWWWCCHWVCAKS